MGDLTFIVAERKTPASAASSSSRSFNVLLYLLVFQVRTSPVVVCDLSQDTPTLYEAAHSDNDFFLPVPPGSDPQRFTQPRLCSLSPLHPVPRAPAQDFDPDQHRCVPIGRGLRQLSSARLRQRTSLQVNTQEATCQNLYRSSYTGFTVTDFGFGEAGPTNMKQ